MKKHILPIILVSAAAISTAVVAESLRAGNLWSNLHMTNIAGLVVEPDQTRGTDGNPVTAGDTCLFGYPLSVTTTEISQSEYTGKNAGYGRSLFYYSDTTTATDGTQTIHYYRDEIQFVYMTLSEDSTTIAASTTVLSADSTPRNLWRAVQGESDGTNYRRYQNLATGKWVRTEVGTDGTVTISLVPDYNNSSALNHQWTRVLDYKQHLRTFAYPLVTDGGSKEYYLYFDKKNNRWAYTSDPSTTTIYPAYYEKWSYAEDCDSLFATALASDTYYAFKADSAKAEADSTATLYIYPQMELWSGYYSVSGVQDGYDTEWLYKEKELTLDFSKMRARGYSQTCSMLHNGGKDLKVYQTLSDITGAGIYNQPDAKYGKQYRDTARLMIDYRVTKDSLSWGTDDPFKMQWFVIRFLPKGHSPLNYIRKTGSGKADGVQWANFTDTLRFAITDKNGREVYAYRQPVIRESYHYYHEQELLPYLSKSEVIFPADGGSVEITYDSLVMENTIKLYTKDRAEKAAVNLEKTKYTPGTQELLDLVDHSAKLEEDPCSWLHVTAAKEFNEGGTSITLTADANEKNINRTNVLLHYFTHKGEKRTYTRIIPITQLNHASAGEVDFAPQGGWGYTTTDGEGRQSVHTYETTIYYYPGERIELRPRERNFYGWQRWYDYNTGADPRFYRSRKDGSYQTQSDFYLRQPAKNISEDQGKLWLYDSINNTAATSHGLYYAIAPIWWMWNGLDAAGELNEQEQALSNMVIPVIQGWDTVGNDLPAERDIAVDMSNYTDYTITSSKIEEPTLSYRQIYHLRPASQIADTLKKCVLKNGKGNYFEDYTITAPVGKDVILRTKYASAFPYNDNATLNRPSDLCYFIPVKINTLGTPRDTLLRLSMSANLDSVEVRFYKDGYLQTPAMQQTDGTYYPTARNPLGSYYDYRKVNRTLPGKVVYEYRIEPCDTANHTYGGSFGKTIWDKYNGISLADTLLLARWTVTFAATSDYGPSTTALITKEQITRDYVMLAEQNFDFDTPGTDTTCVIYPKPLDATESSFGYCYPYSLSKGRSHRGSRGLSGEGDSIPFPYYGEYALVNAVGYQGETYPIVKGKGYAYWGKNIEQHGGAKNGYCLYVDGAQQPGKVVTLSTSAAICSGQQLYCSAWIANANYNHKTQPILQFDIEGYNGTDWVSIGAFCTGPLDGSVNWQQVNFPIVGADNYDRTRISVMNYASDNDGNDFFLDDIYLYASPIPLESFQATTDCSRNAKGDQMVTIIKADYTQFTAVDKYNRNLYYDIYDVSKGKAVTTNYYQGGKAVDSNYGYLTTPKENFTPSDSLTVVSVKALIDSIAQYDSDTTLLRYIRNYEAGKERWVIYLAQLVHQSPLSAKRTYEVRTAYSQADLNNAACAMRTKLPVFEKTAFVFNGETYPAAGQCANGLYPLEILVTDTLTDGDKTVHLQAYAKGDWLVGIEGDDPWYYSYLDPEEDPDQYAEMTDERKAQCDAAFKAAYGYTRDQVDKAIADLRRDTVNRKSNYSATTIDEVNANTEYWDDPSNYEIIKNLVDQKKLLLYQERQQIYMRSNDTCRYWIYPIAGTAKTVYNGNTYILNQCANPTYIMVFSVKSDYVLNLSNKATADITSNDVPRVRISAHNAQSQFYVPIKEIGDQVAICYDSTQVVLSTDPVVSPLIGTSAFSMHFTQDKFIGYTGGATKYYEAGDSISFCPIDQAHVDSMKWIYNNQTGWKEGHPGLWVVNSHPMRAGYEYTLRLQMKARNSNALDDGDSGCLLGYSYINVVVVPDTVVWTPTAMTGDSLYLWSDDRNWRGVVDGKLLDRGYAPLKNTMVILPEHNTDFLNEMKYPTIQPDCDPYILYPEDIHYHTNVCKKVQFRSGAKMLGQENLSYSEAYVNATLPANGWYTVASPLQSTYSGDLFVPHTGKYGEGGTSTESSADFEVKGFEGERTRYAAYALWASYYNRDVSIMTPYGVDTRYSTTANFTESNSMGIELAPGQGFAVAGFGPTDDTQSLTVRLPKPDAEYQYYDSITLQPNGKVESLNRDSAYRLGFVPGSDGAMHIRLEIKNQKTDGSATPIAGQQGFLFGNPTMAYINMAKFLDDNNSVLGVSAYQVEVDGKWQSIKRDVTTTDLFLNPMQSAMVLSADKTGDIRNVEVVLKPEHLSLVPRNRTTTTTESAPARAKAKGRTLRPELMKITALSGGQDKYGDWQYQRGEAQLALLDFTSNGYDSDEDVRFISSGVEYGVNDNTLTTPVNIYTLADNQPLAADLRPEMNTVPLGFVLHSDFRSDSLTLFFHTSTNWSEECYLCDSKTGEKTRLYNDIRVRIATPENHEIRYYLQGEAYTPEGPTTDNDEPTIDSDNRAAEQISVFSNTAEHIVVVAPSDIAEIRVYDLAGRLLTAATPTVGTSVYTLTAPTGIALVDVRLRSDATGHRKVMVQ